MKLFGKRWKRKKAFRSKPPVSAGLTNDAGPKNGLLGLAVVACIMALVGLIYLNLRCMGGPPVALKPSEPPIPGRLVSSQTPSEPGSRSEDELGATGSKGPQVTFYKRLTSQDSQSTAALRDSDNAMPKKGEVLERTQAVGMASPKEHGKEEKHSDNWRAPATANSKPPEPRRIANKLKAKRSGKAYYVQIGEFAKPAEAEKNARMWMAKGYQVSLKPVVESDNGVVYRLCLGKFSSEKQAMEVANRIKSRDGIDAVAVSLSN